MTQPARSQIVKLLGLLLVPALMLIPLSVSAQDGVQFPPQGTVTLGAAIDRSFQVFESTRAAGRPSLSADVVVARMLSFDRNGNARVETNELGDRMHSLVTRGDANADGALDESEIRTLTRTPLTRNTPQIQGFGNKYSFGDDIGLSSRSHIEGAIEDLRLSNLRKESALKVASEFMDAVHKEAAEELLSALEGNLDPERLAEVRAALEDRSNGEARFVVVRSSSKNPTTASGVSKLVVSMFRMTSGVQNVVLVALQVEQLEPALAAVDRYKARLRLNDAERAKLVNSMKDVLSEQDREDFRAAIERRPVVPAGGSVSFQAASVNFAAPTATVFTVEQTIR